MKKSILHYLKFNLTKTLMIIFATLIIVGLVIPPAVPAEDENQIKDTFSIELPELEWKEFEETIDITGEEDLFDVINKDFFVNKIYQLNQSPPSPTLEKMFQAVEKGKFQQFLGEHAGAMGIIAGETKTDISITDKESLEKSWQDIIFFIRGENDLMEMGQNYELKEIEINQIKLSGHQAYEYSFKINIELIFNFAFNLQINNIHTVKNGYRYYLYYVNMDKNFNDYLEEYQKMISSFNFE